MLVVRVEIWPFGKSENAYEISRIGISNVTPESEDSTYEATAIIGRTAAEEVYGTVIDHHERSAGWLALVRRVLTNFILKDDLARPLSYDDPTAEHLRKGHRD